MNQGQERVKILSYVEEMKNLLFDNLVPLDAQLLEREEETHSLATWSLGYLATWRKNKLAT